MCNTRKRSTTSTQTQMLISKCEAQFASNSFFPTAAFCERDVCEILAWCTACESGILTDKESTPGVDP